jgi:serine/threonine-protein kinase
MGDVYAGLDETLQRKVALKAIRSEHRLDALMQARFLREARILSQLDHPNICRAYDYIQGEDSDWLVLELIEGRSLREVSGRLSAADQLKIAEQICAVLVVTHAAGIVHRDLKPGNVMLTPSGDVKVLDFGLARSGPVPHGSPVDATGTISVAPGGDVELTRTAAPPAIAPSQHGEPQFHTHEYALMGTLAYMSPEQARGQTATSASDMFSLGVLLQEVFTGSRAYPRNLDAQALLERVQKAQTDPVSGTQPTIAALIRRLTSLAPSQRPTAVETVERLQWIHRTPARRLRAIAIAVVVLVVTAASVKYTFDLRRERTAAVLAREDADRRRDQAEGLIGFMVGDLRTKLQKAGRLDLLDDVGAKAMGYFAAVPAASLTTEELSRRSQTIYQIGQVRQAQNDLKAATDAYLESLKLAQQVADRDPSNPAWQLGLSTAHFYVGDVLLRQGDLDGAMREFVAYRDIAQRLVERDRSNTTWLLELSYAHGGVAAVQEAARDLPGARQGLELALAMKQDLAGRDPASTPRQQDLAVAHNRLGAVVDRMGEADAALAHYLADVEIRRALVARDPRDRSIKRSLVVAHNFVAVAYEDRGDLPAALEHGRRSLEVAAEQAAADPQNVDWQRDLAVAEYRLATSQRLSGSLAEAAGRLVRAIAILQPIAKAAPTNRARQRELALAKLSLANLELERGNLRTAAAQAADIEALLAPLLTSKTDVEAARVAAEGRLVAAAVHAARREAAQARSLREAALALASGGSTAYKDKRLLAATARALLALDRIDDARPLVAELTRLGYRHPSLLNDWRAKSGAASGGR